MLFKLTCDVEFREDHTIFAEGTTCLSVTRRHIAAVVPPEEYEPRKHRSTRQLVDNGHLVVVRLGKKLRIVVRNHLKIVCERCERHYSHHTEPEDSLCSGYLDAEDWD